MLICADDFGGTSSLSSGLMFFCMDVLYQCRIQGLRNSKNVNGSVGLTKPGGAMAQRIGVSV